MQHSAPRKAERESNIELLRIFAMLCIVGFHAANRIDLVCQAGELSFNRFFVQTLRIGGDLGNSLFVLISGYFLVRSAFSVRRILRMWAQAMFYSLVLGALAAALGRQLSPREWLDVFLPTISERLWFVTFYLLFSFFVPFLNRLLHTLNRRETGLLLLAMLVPFSLLRTVVPGDFGGFTKLTMFFFYYCVGASVRLWPEAVRAFRPGRCFVAAAAVLALLLVYFGLCFHFEGRFSVLRAERFNSMWSLPQVALATLLFLAFKDLRLPRLRLVNAVAGACFGVYLIHYNFLWRDKVWQMAGDMASLGNTPSLAPRVLLAMALIYVCCTLIDMLRLRFVEPLYMRLIDRLPPVRRELERKRQA